jgi:hypothetical protein
LGGVVEWLMAPVLKTGRAQALVGSNPTPSAVEESGQWPPIDDEMGRVQRVARSPQNIPNITAIVMSDK